jgi:hypothetical protein
VADPGHKPIAIPKLNVVAVDQALGFLYCLGVVVTNQRLESNEMAVDAHRVRAVFTHGAF